MNGPRISVTVEKDGDTKPLGVVTPTVKPGSISSDELDGRRQVYIFGWRDGQRGVWRSDAGLDEASRAFRHIFSTGYTLLSDLTEPFQVTIYRNRVPFIIYFVFTDEPAPELALADLVAHRKRTGWTQVQVARKLGTKQGRVSMMENGKLETTPKMLADYANVIGYKP